MDPVSSKPATAPNLRELDMEKADPRLWWPWYIAPRADVGECYIIVTNCGNDEVGQRVLFRTYAEARAICDAHNVTLSFAARELNPARTAAEVAAWEASVKANPPKRVTNFSDDPKSLPYPWCSQPAVCAGRGSCPRDPNCGD